MSRQLSRKKRDQADFFYKRIKNYGYCIYCGAPFSCYDHFVPLSFAQLLSPEEKEKLSAANKLLVIPSCLECNWLLMAKILPTIEERVNTVKSMLVDRYKSILEIGIFSSERAELNYIYLRARLDWQPTAEMLTIAQDPPKPTVKYRAAKSQTHA